MRFTLFSHPAAPALRVMAEATGMANAGPKPDAKSGPVAEIVTFRLADGADVDAFVEANTATESFVQDSGQMISRTLTVDEDGLWTDYILWTSMEAAKATAAQAMQHPSFGPVLQMISPKDMSMRHAHVRLQME